MTRAQTIELRRSELRQQIGDLLDTPAEQRADTFDADLAALTAKLKASETELQAALTLDGDAGETREGGDGEGEGETRETAEERELRELRERVTFGPSVAAALSGNGVTTGPEAEYNQHLAIPADRFPLDLLADGLPAPDLEERAKIDGDVRANQGSWIDRLFADTAARRLGITMPSVRPGVSAYPVITSDANPAQRGRTQAATAATITAAVTEIKPTRSSVHAVYSIEDDARLPGLSDAILRDLRGAMVEKIDRTIFRGDTGANEAGARITGLQTAGITEVTLTQSNKVKGDEVLKLIAGLIDGVHAASVADVHIVATVGSNTLWLGTVQNSAASNDTIAKFLRDNGVSWITRGRIEDATSNGDFGAFFGLRRGIQNAGVAPVWSSGQLVRDPYSGATKGEVGLTLHYLWGLAFPRVASFRRLKYVT